MTWEDVELVVDAHAVVGEGPVWDERDDTLLWVDIESSTVHRYDPESGEDTAYDVGQYVGAVVPRESGGYALAVSNGFATADMLGAPIQMYAEVEGDVAANRMNDGKCDPAGRFWAGTMSMDETIAGAGSLYRLDRDGSVHRAVEGVSISNGLGWSPDHTRMYFIDTPTGRVDVFDYDSTTGDICNRRPFVAIPPEQGAPDGMTVDSDGYLWVALWGGWAVHRYTPDGELDRRIRLPVAYVSSCSFGGSDLEDLYITSAGRDVPAELLVNQPHAGGLFLCRPGVTGRPAFPFAG